MTKIHLLGWEVLCRPKERWSFGLKTAKGMNKTLLAKLGWRLVKQGEAMWAKTLGLKYGISDDGLVVFKHKQRASLTWKGLEWPADLLCNGLIWKAVNGSRIRLWE